MGEQKKSQTTEMLESMRVTSGPVQITLTLSPGMVSALERIAAVQGLGSFGEVIQEAVRDQVALMQWGDRGFDRLIFQQSREGGLSVETELKFHKSEWLRDVEVPGGAG